MAEQKEDESQEEVKPKSPRGGSKGLLIIIGILALALAGGVVAYMHFASGKNKREETRSEEKKAVKTALIALDPFVMNLAEQGRFLKVSMQFELGDAANQQMVADKTPQLRDAIITLMSSKSAETVSSPEGKFQLKDELLLRANQAVGKEIFRNLYFTEFVMQ